MAMDFSGSRWKRLEQLIEIQHELTAAVSRELVLQRLAAATLKLVQCQLAGVLLFDEAIKQLRYAATTHYADKLVNLPVPLDGSIAGASFSSGDAIAVIDAAKDPRYYRGPEMASGEKITSLLAVPLHYKKRRLGVLMAMNKQGGREFTTEDAAILGTLSPQATIAIDNATLYTTLQFELDKRRRSEKDLRKQQTQLKDSAQECQRELTSTQAEVKRLNRLLKEAEDARHQLEADMNQAATTDPLTGVFNRHQFYVLAEQAFQQGRRYGTPVGIAIADIDRFKRINDAYGHTIGDQAIKRLAGFLAANLRASDILGRLEGQEFAILMPETNLSMVCQAADRLLEGVRLLTISTPQQPLHLTLSLGVTELDHLKDKSIDEWIARAGQALSEAKAGGRDRVVLQR